MWRTRGKPSISRQESKLRLIAGFLPTSTSSSPRIPLRHITASNAYWKPVWHISVALSTLDPNSLVWAPFFSSVFPLFLLFWSVSSKIAANPSKALESPFKSTPIVQLHLKLSSNTLFGLFSVRFWADSVVLPDCYASPIFDLLSTVSSLCLATSLPIRRLRSARLKKSNLESFHPRKSCATTFFHL
jgi:hypothetical protein